MQISIYPPRKNQANLLICLLLFLFSTNAFSNDMIEVLSDMTITALPENYFVEEANTATRNQTSLLETPFSVGVISKRHLIFAR